MLIFTAFVFAFTFIAFNYTTLHQQSFFEKGDMLNDPKCKFISFSGKLLAIQCGIIKYNNNKVKNEIKKLKKN